MRASPKRLPIVRYSGGDWGAQVEGGVLGGVGVVRRRGGAVLSNGARIPDRRAS